MDAGERVRRWTSAKEKLQAAQLCYDQSLYGESITRSYYACYQAMWVAVGDPALGLWRHGGLINESAGLLRAASAQVTLQAVSPPEGSAAGSPYTLGTSCLRRRKHHVSLTPEFSYH